jgi:HlyD family secretion protein
MKFEPVLGKIPEPLRRRRVLVIGSVLAVVGLALFLILRPARNNGPTTAYHQVRRGDFTVSVVEGGTLAAVREVSIRNEVEGTARIISIVPEGSYVKKGDLLVELDSAQAQDQVNQQQISFEKAKFGVEQATAQLEIMRSSTNSDFLAAELKVKFAQLDLDKYLEGQRNVDLIEASNKVVQARAQFAVNLDTYINSTNLAAKGYETKQKVEGDRLLVLNNANALIVATNSAWMLEKFDSVKQMEKYLSDVYQAKQELERVASQNRRKMAQYEADLLTQNNTLALSEQKLARDKRNLAATKLIAPQDGLVVYQVSDNHFSSESLIEGGAVVRNRQELIKLPDLSRMKVTVKVHESHVGMVRPGLPAFVILDSLPDQRFAAVVERVAPLPDTQSRWGNPNLKVYLTEVYLTDAIPNVKPGVSARAEIIVTNISDTLSVPIQAVTTLNGKQVVYMVNSRNTEPRPVEVGMYNTKFIEITKGLNEGERVLLSPPFDTQEKAETSEENQVADGKYATNRPPSRVMPVADLAGAPPVEAEPGRPAPGEAAPGPAGERQGRRNGPIPEAILKQFDKNNDGQLDESERTAMRESLPAGKRPAGQGGGRRARDPESGTGGDAAPRDKQAPASSGPTL